MIDTHVPTSNELAQSRTELADRRTHLADSRTSLAVTRTVMAQDRTLMAWVRTSTSLISFGFTIYKFFQYLQTDESAAKVDRLLTPRAVGLVMIALGVGALALATVEYRKQLATLRQHYPDYGLHGVSLAEGVAGVVAGLGVLGFILVFLRQ